MNSSRRPLARRTAMVLVVVGSTLSACGGSDGPSSLSTLDGNAPLAYLAYLRAGVDGVVSDFANTAVAARATDLKETDR